MPTAAEVNRVKNGGLYFVDLSSGWGGVGRGLGKLCLDFLGHMGVSGALK